MVFQPFHPELTGVEARTGRFIRHIEGRPGPVTAYRLSQLRKFQAGVWKLFEDNTIEPALELYTDPDDNPERTVHSVSFSSGELVLSQLAMSWDGSYSAIGVEPNGHVTYRAGFVGTRATTEFNHTNPVHRRQLKIALNTARLLLP